MRDMSEKIITQNGIQFGWKPLKVKPAVVKDGFYGMKSWQQSAYERLADAPYIALNAPMGSGKSWMMCVLAAYKMKKDPRKRCIFAVPQTIIANGFAEANLLMPDGEKLHWFAQHDLQ